MQRAVDIVLASPHPDNKVAATLFNDAHSLSKTNDWPPLISEKIGTDTRIGDSSGTLHAEVNCILHADFKTHGASLCITDPCCPNCAKSIAEAGIKNVFIDHKGFLKDFAVRRGDEFQDMSLRILAHAGISIYEVIRKENNIRTIYKPDEGYVPPEDNPIEILPCRENLSEQTLLKTAKLVKIKHERWACALATDKDGKVFTLVASAHPAIGYTQQDIEKPDGKYDFYLEPLNRIMMGAAYHHLKLDKNLVWTSVLPTPREMVNAVGYGIKTIYLGTRQAFKKEASLKAFNTLIDSKIINFIDDPI